MRGLALDGLLFPIRLEMLSACQAVLPWDACHPEALFTGEKRSFIDLLKHILHRSIVKISEWCFIKFTNLKDIKQARLKLTIEFKWHSKRCGMRERNILNADAPSQQIKSKINLRRELWINSSVYSIVHFEDKDLWNITGPSKLRPTEFF